eukprot:660345-Hanusia_phi.AAC.2
MVSGDARAGRRKRSRGGGGKEGEEGEEARQKRMKEKEEGKRKPDPEDSDEEGGEEVPLELPDGGVDEQLEFLLKGLNGAGRTLSSRLKIFQDVVMEALKAFEASADETSKQAMLLKAYLDGSPEAAEICRLLAPEKMKETKRMLTVLRLLSAMVACHKMSAFTQHARNIATKLIRKHYLALFEAMSGKKFLLFAECMRLLRCVCSIGIIQCRDCWKKTSPQMKNIVKMMELPKVHNRQEVSERPKTREARGAVISWVVKMLQTADVELMQAIIGTSGLFSSILAQIGGDDISAVREFLVVVNERVVCNRDVSFSTVAQIFTPNNLEQLSCLLSVKAGDEGKEMVRRDATGLLRRLCCETLSSRSYSMAQSNVKLLIPFLTSLKVLDDPFQLGFVCEVLARHPQLHPHYLRASPFTMSPVLSLKFLSMAAALVKMLSTIPKDELAPLFLLGHDAHEVSALTNATSVADWIAPKQICKTFLSPGLQHASYLVRLSTCHLLTSVLLRLEFVVRRFSQLQEGGRGGRAAGGGDVARMAAEFLDHLKQIVRKQVPDFQVIVAVRQHASSCISANDKNAEGAKLLMPRILQSSSTIDASSLTLVFQVLNMYLIYFPESIAESRIDLSKFLSDQFVLSSPSSLLHLLRCLNHAPSQGGSWFAANKKEERSNFGNLMKIVSAVNVPPPLRLEARAAAIKLLLDFGLVPPLFLLLLLLLSSSWQLILPLRSLYLTSLSSPLSPPYLFRDLNLIPALSLSVGGRKQEAKIWLSRACEDQNSEIVLERLCMEATKKLQQLISTAMEEENEFEHASKKDVRH